MNDKQTKNNLSVGKMLQIIEVLARNKGPMSLQDISRQLKLPASTAFRFINTLVAKDYARQDENLKYGLTLKICEIGELVRSQFDIREVVKPYLAELSEKCQESSCLAIEENESVVYIDVVEGPDKMLRTMQRIGKRAPLYCTGVGKLMLLEYLPTDIDRMIAEKGLSPLTEHTITTKERLLSELEKIRKQGFALDDEECEVGARCIAAPVIDYTGHIIACISVSGPVSRMDMHKIDTIKEAVISIAQQISHQLGKQ